MTRFENVITSAPFGQQRSNMKVNGSAEAQMHSVYGQNILQMPRMSSPSKAKDLGSQTSIALKIFELARSLEKILHENVGAASQLAALSAKISVHAQDLGMNKTMALAQDLGERAMEGDHAASEMAKRYLQIEMMSELSKLP